MKKVFTVLEAKYLELKEKGFVPFLVEIDKEHLWNTYLKKQDNGEVFRTQKTYDCNNCRYFITGLPVVFVNKKGEKDSLYNIDDEEILNTYKAFPTLHNMLIQAPIKSQCFISHNANVGCMTNKDTHDPTIIWEHIYAKSLVKDTRTTDFAAKLGESVTTFNVLKIIYLDFKDNVDLLKDVKTMLPQLYKGEDYASLVDAVIEFIEQINNADIVKDEQVWYYSATKKFIARFKNSVVGRFCYNLKEGKALDDAIKAWYDMTDPTKYKRSNKVVSPAVVKRVVKRIRDLGLEPALERKHLSFTEFPIEHALYIKRNNKNLNSVISGSVLDNIVDSLKERENKVKVPENIAEINVFDFIDGLAKGKFKDIELGIKTDIKNKMVSLIGPVHKDAPNIFKWNNPYSWSYLGGLSDSSMTTEKVRQAGGKVSGKLRISLAWFHRSDYDLHVRDPKAYISYINKHPSGTDGYLDVDMNVDGETLTPVENVIYSHRANLHEGKYSIFIHNFNERAVTEAEANEKAIVEIFFYDELAARFILDETIPHKRKVHVCDVLHKNGELTIENINTQFKTEKFVDNTVMFVPVDIISYTPNWWGETKIGDPHILFLFKDVKVNDVLRGFQPDMVRGDLYDLRKAIQFLSEKIEVASADEQVSGYGFSLNRGFDTIIRANVDGKTKMLCIKFENKNYSVSSNKNASEKTIEA